MYKLQSKRGIFKILLLVITLSLFAFNTGNSFADSKPTYYENVYHGLDGINDLNAAALACDGSNKIELNQDTFPRYSTYGSWKNTFDKIVRTSIAENLKAKGNSSKKEASTSNKKSISASYTLSTFSIIGISIFLLLLIVYNIYIFKFSRIEPKNRKKHIIFSIIAFIILGGCCIFMGLNKNVSKTDIQAKISNTQKVSEDKKTDKLDVPKDGKLLPMTLTTDQFLAIKRNLAYYMLYNKVMDDLSNNSPLAYYKEIKDLLPKIKDNPTFYKDMSESESNRLNKCMVQVFAKKVISNPTQTLEENEDFIKAMIFNSL